MLLVRGPSIFGGYLNYTGASPFVRFEDRDWYRTGDLVKEGPDGTLTFAGRLKRFVKLGGEMISLPAVEDVLAQRYVKPTDDEPVLAVEATPAELNPELVLFTIRDLDRDEVNTAIRTAGLSALHNIRVVRRVDKIPTLGTGKTDYRALKDILRTTS
jgi:long-chain-fatty-acid--[acyl-carrier-protein] ligase